MESVATTEGAPRLVSTASALLTLPMHVPHLPAEGTSVTASSSSALVGDGFVVAASARRQGVAVSHASPLGTGANSHAVRAALIEENIDLAVEDMVGDTGMSISLIQSDGLMTTVRSPGVEADPQLSDLRRVEVKPGDCVYISGVDLAGPGSGWVLSRWAEELPEGVKLALSLGGAIEDVPLELLHTVFSKTTLLTMNVRQGNVLTRRFNGEDPLEVCRRLLPPEAAIVWRRGAEGSIFQEHANAPLRQTPAFLRPRVDTTGVGDTHTGVLIANLLLGKPMAEAVLRANIAAAIAVSKFGTAVCPEADQIDRIILHEGLDAEAMAVVYQP
ncbi:hypothetical protein BK816_05830 [Boudabousia tangfeifanii]|uniref:Carbohydrate kinase PfkB domain-containing protein n=1 Tax=Boudabousia tangfeifanii TaxID=1912795 RepID=A0A1D9MKJ5_9ACTO|nr:PfkB family carbohydrate kinase [Boudabousia tangfeifanii]AOZ72871.1 hypothetical protein BK816_05830 [Boudabousia tangfeifanii]